MKFLNKVNDCVQHIILQKFTNSHAIWSWSFQNICNEIGWPRFLRHLVYYIALHELSDYCPSASRSPVIGFVHACEAAENHIGSFAYLFIGLFHLFIIILCEIMLLS